MKDLSIHIFDNEEEMLEVAGLYHRTFNYNISKQSEDSIILDHYATESRIWLVDVSLGDKPEEWACGLKVDNLYILTDISYYSFKYWSVRMKRKNKKIYYKGEWKNNHYSIE